MNRKLFIVAALQASASSGTAGAGVWYGPGDSPRAATWTSPSANLADALAPDSASSALTTGAAEAVAPTPSVPGFESTATINLANLFAESTPRANANPERPRWSRLSAPTGLPTSTGPLERPGMPDAQGGENWTDPVGVLFAAETIRPTSGFARFIPAPGTAPAWLCCGLMCSLRRRESR